MIKSILPLLTASILAVSIQAAPNKPQRSVNMEEVAKVRKLLTTDAEIKEIRKEYHAALFKRLTKLGVSEGVAKRALLRMTAGQSTDRRPQGPRRLKTPPNPLKPGWSEEKRRPTPPERDGKDRKPRGKKPGK